MEYIIGGYLKNPNLIVDNALNYFENIYSQTFDFEGLIEGNYFFGIIKEKSNKQNKNIFFIDNNKLFKSLYYNEIPGILKTKKEGLNYDNETNNLINDFIFVKYEKNKGIKIYIDKFAREKIYYTITPPFLFSTSQKFLISNLEVKNINYNALTRFLIIGVLNGNETIFSKINRLDIGEYLFINNQKIRVNKYWKISKDFFHINEHDKNDISYWEKHLYDSLKDALDLPVKKPILSMMSGGLDSTVITSILSKEYDIPIEALTIIIPNYNEEEGQVASEIAEYLNIPHKIRKTKLDSLKILENFYLEIFNIMEEPMGGTGFFSRYFAFKEIEKTNNQNILMGDGAGEILSYLRESVIKKFKYTNYLYYVPLKLRSNLMNFLHKFYYPSLKLSSKLKNKDSINSLAIIMNTNFLQSNSQFETYFSSWQWTSLEELARMTKYKVDFKTYLSPIRKNVASYPFNDYNNSAYHTLINGINSDSLIAHNLSSFLGLKLYCPYASDIAFQRILPIPPYLKIGGYRSKWFVREMAKRMKLLPKNYFKWKPKYGLRQIFYTEHSLELVKSYILTLIESLNESKFMNFKKFTQFFKKSTLKTLTTHSSEYMKFNIWLGFLGWLSSIEL